MGGTVPRKLKASIDLQPLDRFIGGCIKPGEYLLLVMKVGPVEKLCIFGVITAVCCGRVQSSLYSLESSCEKKGGAKVMTEISLKLIKSRL